MNLVMNRLALSLFSPSVVPPGLLLGLLAYLQCATDSCT